MLGSSAHIAVRRARVADAKALAEVFAQSWRYTYRAIIPHLHLETMIQRRGADWWLSSVRAGECVLVLEVGGKIAGYATWGASRTRGTHQGEIYELYILPEYQGLGFGEHLFEACRHQLDQRKMKGLIVWALYANTPAIDFYWRRGGRPVGKTYDKIGGAKLEKIAFAWG
jgi:ribosomal protein S18 acetylase RimI-like enzyme